MSAFASEATLSDLSVMVVDDDKDMLRLMRTMLHRIGMQKVALFADPEEALQTSPAKAPDVVICDWELKVMDGGTFVEKFRETPTGRADPAIFFLTGRPLTERVETARRLGVQGFLAKPISPKVLQARLLKISQQARPSGAPDTDHAAAPPPGATPEAPAESPSEGPADGDANEDANEDDVIEI